MREENLTQKEATKQTCNCTYTSQNHRSAGNEKRTKRHKLHNTSALSVRNSWSRVANKWARSTWQNQEDSSTSSFWNLSTKSKWLMTNQHGWFHYQQSIISKLLILLSERKILERIIKDESAGVFNIVLTIYFWSFFLFSC